MEKSNVENETPAGPNLMILKGIVWGLGALLLVGFALVAVIIAKGPDRSYADKPPTLELSEGDVISSTAFDEGKLLTVVERDGVPHRIVIIDMRTNETLTLPVMITAP